MDVLSKKEVPGVVLRLISSLTLGLQTLNSLMKTFSGGPWFTTHEFYYFFLILTRLTSSEVMSFEVTFQIELMDLQDIFER